MAYQVILMGNPNVGKSTVFNALTGLKQHTGNWTGKTVDPARGRWNLEGKEYEIVDLPGIYSLEGGTPEELVAADYLRAHPQDVLVVVLDATALERSLALALELRKKNFRLVLCLNLMDEAERLGGKLDLSVLTEAMNAPVVPVRADRKQSYEQLRRVIAAASSAKDKDTFELSLPDPKSSARAVPNSSCELIWEASEIAEAVTKQHVRGRRDWDRLLLGKWTSVLTLFLLLFGLFYLTIRGANLPSELLERALDAFGGLLKQWLRKLPPELCSLLVEGVYETTAKVVAVMLPPMAIFFPLFSLLEDLGFLPRVAFLADRPFGACGSCGRQGLCMCMGIGCNAVGVTGCRIIPDPKARLAAILTNSLVPCNGRFPTLILLTGILLGLAGEQSACFTAMFLTMVMLLSFLVTMGLTGLLRSTLLKGQGRPFLLELPPFRRPRMGQLLVRSLVDRTLRVLARAVRVAAPAGACIWFLSHLRTGGRPLLELLAAWLDPAAAIMGLTGTLLLAFLLSFPANELLLPLAVLIAGNIQSPGLLFTARTAFCAIVFTLFHWPCSTTVLTVWHETKSMKWTLLSVVLPTVAGILLCTLANTIFLIIT